MRAIRVTIIAAGLLALPAAAGLPAFAASGPTGSIDGRVIDAQGSPVAGAHVVLCEQKSGIPLSDRFRPLSEELLEGRRGGDFAHAVSGDRGRFGFAEVPAGEYRLVAQSWKDAELSSEFVKIKGKAIELRGVADHIRASPEASPHVVLRPLGTGTLRVDDNIGKSGVWVVVSTAPLRGDPILGVAAWGGAFAQNTIGGGRKEKGTLTVTGLPKGKIHVALCGMVVDDECGFGAGEAEVKPNRTTDLSVPVMSSWAKGHPGPPQRLAPLIEKARSLGAGIYLMRTIKANRIAWDEKAVPSWENLWYFYREIGRHMQREVELPSGGKATFGDVMAACLYVQARQREQRRAEKQRKDRPEPEKPGKNDGAQAGDRRKRGTGA